MHTKRSLFWQLYLSLLLLMVTSLTTLAVYIIGNTKDSQRRKISEDHTLYLSLIGEELGLPQTPHLGLKGSSKLSKAFKEWQQRLGPETSLSLHAANGELIYADPAVSSEDGYLQSDTFQSSPELWEEILEAQTQGHSQVIRAIREAPFASKGLYFINALQIPSGESGHILRIAKPLDIVDAWGNRLYSDYFIVFLISILASALVCWWISSKLSTPLEKMTYQANQMAAGDFSVRINRSQITTKEIYKLILAMNKMSRQLRRRLKTIMEEKNEKETILSNMYEGVLAVTNNMRVISMNFRASQILGCDFSVNFQKKSLIEVVRIPEVEDFFLRANQSEFNLEEKKQLIVKGQQREVFLKSNPYMVDQKRKGTVVVISDITKLQKLEAIRKDFVANVSHELKTPLTSIHGYAETLLSNPDVDSETQTRFLQKIEKHSAGLTQVIEDLLELSRLENSKGEDPGFRSVRMELVGQRVQEELGDLADDKKVHLEVKKLQSLCQGQKGLITQALLNLVKNAIRYTPEGGKIQVYEEVGESFFYIHVKDNGVGIDEAHLHRLFERFYRVDESRTRKSKSGAEKEGTGLGLAIVKHIALIHHGDISVKSKRGEGSIFSLRLPLLKQTLS